MSTAPQTSPSEASLNAPPLCEWASPSGSALPPSLEKLVCEWRERLAERRHYAEQAGYANNMAMHYWNDGYADALEMVTLRLAPLVSPNAEIADKGSEDK